MNKVFLGIILGLSLCAGQKQIPNIQLKRLNGERVMMESYYKKGPVLIDFWATWCAPCKKEMIYLDQFEKTYGDSGLYILAISQDSQKSMSKVRSYIKSKQFSFEVFVDPNQQLAKKLNAKLLPTILLVDKNGKIIWRHQGYMQGDEQLIEEQIKNVLRLSI